MAFARGEQGMSANRHEEEGGIGPIVKGLRNIGNTCYFNSVMQNLLAVDRLREHFMEPTEFPEGPITSALRKLYFKTSSQGSEKSDDSDNDFAWWSTADGIVNPDFLYSAVCAKVPQFRGFRQQDSHEFLRCLLDNLHTEELLSLSNSKPANSGESTEGNKDQSSNQMNNVTLVDRVFLGQLCSIVTCSKCGYQSVMYEPFHDLSLSIPSKPQFMKDSSPKNKFASWFADSLPSKPQSMKDSSPKKKFSSWFADSLFDILENQQPVENQWVENNNPDSVCSLPDGSQSLIKDSEVSPLPYKKMDSMAGEDDNVLFPTCSDDFLYEGLDTPENVQGVESSLPHKEMDSVAVEEPEVTHVSAELNTDDALDTQTYGSIILPLEPYDDILHLLDDDDSSALQEKKTEVGECKSILNNENEGDNFFMSMFATKEISEEEEATINPMSIDGCLVEFTRPEPLSAENGWKCPNCASEFVHGSDNLEKKTAREYSVPVHDSSAQGVSCSHAEDHSDKNVLGILVAEDSAEITGINQTERPASTSSGQEDDRKSVNLEHQKFRSSGEGHRLKRRKSQIIEHEAKSKAIIQEATKRYLISEAPPVLTIHLKRFKRNFFGDLSKLSGHVAFQEKLDLRPYLDPR